MKKNLLPPLQAEYLEHSLGLHQNHIKYLKNQLVTARPEAVPAIENTIQRLESVVASLHQQQLTLMLTR